MLVKWLLIFVAANTTYGAPNVTITPVYTSSYEECMNIGNVAVGLVNKVRENSNIQYNCVQQR